jgi:AhpC/TSA family
MSALIAALVQTLALGASLAGTVAVDLDGHPVAKLAPAGSRAVVLFFAASDCPISNRYVPEVQRMAKEFEPRGVHIWFVYPNPGDNASVVRAHQAEFSVTTSTALDTKQNLVQMTHVTVTPEAAVLVPEGAGLREVYHGRLDDRYVALGQERPAAVHHDLEEAIRAVLAGKPIPQPGGPPVGCSIVTLQR